MRKNNLDTQYLALLQDILDNGIVKEDRTGTGTISVFGRQIRHKMSEGFPLLTSKKMAWNPIKTELSCFVGGITDIRYLWKNNCHIWDGDWYREYKKEASFPLSLESLIKIGLEKNPTYPEALFSMGPIYGKQWRSWGDEGIDQLMENINTLINNPDSRRMLVSAWNVRQLEKMVLPPCHILFQFYTRELTLEEKIQWVMESTDVEMENLAIVEEAYKDSTPKRSISLQWYQRSVDTPLGLPFNIASYGLLLEMIANEVNMVPDELIAALGDTHIYLNQVEGVKEQLKRVGLFPNLPFIKIQDGIYSCLVGNSKDVILEQYEPMSKIKFPLSN